MKIPKIPLAQTVVKLCELKGIQHIVISPGSRNAPLIIGFSNNSFFKCYSIVDERSAAFFALGIAQQTQTPVALVCTSGSALLNYYPAIAEAYYSNIPLVILSADRPNYLLGIGDGQTIDQNDVYGKHVVYSVNLKEDLVEKNQFVNDEPTIIKSIENRFEKYIGLQENIQNENENEVNKALNLAISDSGPVHINIPFNEPLYEMVDDYTLNPINIEPKLNNSKTNSNELQELVNDWNKSSKKLILVGTLPPNTIEQKWLDNLAGDDSLIVFTETTSNLHHIDFFPSIDKIIMPLDDSELKHLQPEILLTIGGMIVSKKIKAFLRNHQPKQHWHISLHKANDTFFCLNKRLKGNPNTFLSQFLPLVINKKSEYKQFWNNVKEIRAQKHQRYLKDISFSDLKAFEIILKSIPDHTMLQVGNSSPIRYTQLFDLNKNVNVFCNRGASGIDGCSSTAIGSAVVAEVPTILITGDLGFLYDSNALWNNYIKDNFRIILINNGGGGIFRILPGHKNTENFDNYFETIHNKNAKHLCDMFNFEYQSVANENDLQKQIDSFYDQSEKPKLLEVFTPRTENDSVLLNYFQKIK
jgi:2-succinyl-5-enolpyruvyl-6-hydroxy-3-cyclohexene-1-carboxylate synthase